MHRKTAPCFLRLGSLGVFVTPSTLADVCAAAGRSREPAVPRVAVHGFRPCGRALEAAPRRRGEADGARIRRRTRATRGGHRAAAMRSCKNGGTLAAAGLLLLLACSCVNELDAFMHQPLLPVRPRSHVLCSMPAAVRMRKGPCSERPCAMPARSARAWVSMLRQLGRRVSRTSVQRTAWPASPGLRQPSQPTTHPAPGGRSHSVSALPRVMCACPPAGMCRQPVTFRPLGRHAHASVRMAGCRRSGTVGAGGLRAGGCGVPHGQLDGSAGGLGAGVHKRRSAAAI